MPRHGSKEHNNRLRFHLCQYFIVLLPKTSIPYLGFDQNNVTMDFKYRNIHCYPCHHSPKHFGNRRFEQKQRTAKALKHFALQRGRH